MTEEDSDVFEITDFTTASEWERFIAKLEEVLHELKLSQNSAAPLEKGELTTGNWEEKQEEVQFADFKFVLTRHYLVQKLEENRQDEGSMLGVAETPDVEHKPLPGKKQNEGDVFPVVWQDMMSADNDFPGKAHCLCRWYGLRDFVILQPAPKMDDIMTESRAKILQSSVAIAVTNTNCTVPVFVAVHSKWRRLYQGHYEIPGFRTSFEMVHLKQAPQQHHHLSGLLDIFKAKLNCPSSPLPPASVAIRFTYVLQEWAFYTWLQGPVDMETSTSAVGDNEDDNKSTADFEQLPFGACEDPVSDLQLSTTWPALSEDMVVDDDVYSDLNPLQAPIWSAKVRTTDNVQCLLGDYLEEFIIMCKRTESTHQLLGKSLTEDTKNDAPAVSDALTRLTDPAYNLTTIGKVVSKTTTVVTRATSKLQMKPDEAPIPSVLLNDLLLYLFPDAKDEVQPKDNTSEQLASDSIDTANTNSTCDNSTEGMTNTSNNKTGDNESAENNTTGLPDMFKQFKSAPCNSLTYRLAVVMCIVNHSYGGIRAVAHLWQEFVLEMRYRLENNYIVPNLESGSPNMGCSLLHQKLQMLNCCIERKQAREANVRSSESSEHFTPTKKASRSSRQNKEQQHKRSSKLNTSTDGWDCEQSPSISSDEEFFECPEEEQDNGFEPMETSATSNKSERTNETMDCSDVVESDRLSTSTPEPGADSSSSKRSKQDCSQDDAKDALAKSQTLSSHSLGKVSGEKTENESPGDTTPDTSFIESWTHQPEGRKQPYLHLTLLSSPTEPLYVPITQEPSPMTEDMLEQHAEVLSKLGTSQEGMHLRARMQSACLLSDMESFKAANPGCLLADFVRWYSPRDWVEKEEMDENGEMVSRGELSQRMQIPGNMWVEVWQSAKPVRARRQRRLFDDTKEAEKVLHWLAAMKPADVAMRLMPMLVHSAMGRLHEQEESRLPVVKAALESVSQRAAKVMRAPTIQINKFEEAVNQVSYVEQLITRAQSLQQKLVQQKEGINITSKDLHRFVSDLLQQPEVAIPGAAHSPIGQIIHKLFQAAQKSSYMISEDDDEDENLTLDSASSAGTSDGNPQQANHHASSSSSNNHKNNVNAIPDFPKPAGKEYILRTSVVRPAPWSRPSPQRLYAILLKNEFRLLGAFTNDTTFM